MKRSHRIVEIWQAHKEAGKASSDLSSVDGYFANRFNNQRAKANFTTVDDGRQTLVQQWTKVSALAGLYQML